MTLMKYRKWVKKKMAVSSLEFTVYCTMSDVHVHLIQWALGRGNELELPRAGITLMTLRAALCAVTFDLCSSSSPKDDKTHTHAHGHLLAHLHTLAHILSTQALIDLAHTPP